MRFLRIIFWSGIILVAGIAFFVVNSDLDINVEDEDIRIELSDNEPETIQSVEWSELTDFDEVSLSGAYKVTVHDADQSKVEVEGSEEQIAKIKAEVKGETLVIKQRNKTRLKTNQIHIHIYAPTLESIRVSGGVDMKSADPVDADELEIKVSGAGKVDMQIEAREVEVGVSGAAKFELAGNAEEAEYSISGAGDIRAFDLVAERVKVSISGAGNAQVHATQRLDAQISGAGKVVYDGNPSEGNRKVFGAGAITKR